MYSFMKATEVLFSYSATKFAVRGLTQSAGTWGPFFYRVLYSYEQLWTGSVGTREARHHRKCVRPRGSGDTASSVTSSFSSRALIYKRDLHARWYSRHIR